MRHVILDTDIGTDVDDLLALVFMAKAPELCLEGVTTVHGDTLLRAKIARVTCTEAWPPRSSGGTRNPLKLSPDSRFSGQGTKVKTFRRSKTLKSRRAFPPTILDSNSRRNIQANSKF